MERENKHVKITVVGDVQVNRQKPEEAFSFVQNVFDDSDFRFCQLESTISEKGEVRPDIQNPAHRVPSKMVKAFSDAKINAVTMAGNNNLDYGPAALFDTVNILKENHIDAIGVGRDIDEARQPHYYEIKGMKIAILNFCSILRTGFSATNNRTGVSPLHVSTFYESLENIYEQPGTPCKTITLVNRKDLKEACKLISFAKKNSDFVITCFHWGVHFTHDLAIYQPDVAYSAIDAGADVVIGTHPHCLQPADIYKQKPIFYSLGNFIFDQPEKEVNKNIKKYLKVYNLSPKSGADNYPHPKHCRDTMILKLYISKEKTICKIIPAFTGSDGTTRVVDRNSVDGKRIFNLIQNLSNEYKTNLTDKGTYFLLEPQNKKEDSRVLIKERQMSYPWLYRLRVAEEPSKK